MARTDRSWTTAYRGQELPTARRQAAHLISSLEEDKTGRQPISFSSGKCLDALGNPDLTDGLAHVFLDDPYNPACPGATIGYARVDLRGRTAELAMLPDSSQQVSALARGVQDRFGIDRFWAKGRESAAAALDATVIRHLSIMTRKIALPEPTVEPGPNYQIRPFNPTIDTAQWLRINSQIFANLPDQANVTRDDLMALINAEWFDPAGFLVAESTSGSRHALVGFHWTKVSPAERIHHRVSGEVFVLGVMPEFHGTGIATALLDSGLQRIRSLGVSNAHLFVEAGNERAHSFYASQGFSDSDEDQLLQLDS